MQSFKSVGLQLQVCNVSMTVNRCARLRSKISRSANLYVCRISAFQLCCSASLRSEVCHTSVELQHCTFQVYRTLCNALRLQNCNLAAWVIVGLQAAINTNPEQNDSDPKLMLR